LTEEEKFWAEKERQANTGIVSKVQDPTQKKYELLLDNQVEFVKSNLMKGQEPKQKKKKHDTDESMDEEDFEAMEKRLTPIERERLLIK
jgi:pre-mRNA-splicing factor ATP-dependent RNA helicase DHX16